MEELLFQLLGLAWSSESLESLTCGRLLNFFLGKFYGAVYLFSALTLANFHFTAVEF